MDFKPFNRHVVLQENEKAPEESTPTILVPDDYKVKTNPHEIYRVVAVAEDCTKISKGDIGTNILVNESMVEIVSAGDAELLLVLENHIYGAFRE